MSPSVVTETRTKTKSIVAVGIGIAAVAFILFRNYQVSQVQFTIVSPSTRPTFAAFNLSSAWKLSYGYVLTNRVNVSVPLGNSITLKGFSYKMTTNLSAGVTVTSPSLHPTSIPLGTSGFNTTSIGTATFEDPSACGFVAANANEKCVRVIFGTPQVLTGGSLKGYDLYVYVGGQPYALASGNSLTTMLLGDSTSVYGSLSGTSGADFGINSTTQNQVWNDSGANWWNGAYAVGLPGPGQVISHP